MLLFLRITYSPGQCNLYVYMYYNFPNYEVPIIKRQVERPSPLWEKSSLLMMMIIIIIIKACKPATPGSFSSRFLRENRKSTRTVIILYRFVIRFHSNMKNRETLFCVYTRISCKVCLFKKKKKPNK